MFHVRRQIKEEIVSLLNQIEDFKDKVFIGYPAKMFGEELPLIYLTESSESVKIVSMRGNFGRIQERNFVLSVICTFNNEEKSLVDNQDYFSLLIENKLAENRDAITLNNKVVSMNLINVEFENNEQNEDFEYGGILFQYEIVYRVKENETGSFTN